MEEQKKEEKKFQTYFSTKEKFVGEVEKFFRSLKDHQPFSLEVNMAPLGASFEGDVRWRITSPHGCRWSIPEVEFMLDVVTSRQTPNVKETKVSLSDNSLGDISDQVCKLLSKLNNLTHLKLGGNELRVVPPLLGDLIHLQKLYLINNMISAEGVVGVCELLKVCYFIGSSVG